MKSSKKATKTVTTKARAKTLRPADKAISKREAARLEEERKERVRARDRERMAKKRAEQRAAKAPAKGKAEGKAPAAPTEVAITKDQLVTALDVEIARARAGAASVSRVKALELARGLAALLGA